MSQPITILGRGRAGLALAAALGAKARCVPHDTDPPADEHPVLLAVPDHAIAATAARFGGRCAHMSGSLHLETVPCAHPLTSFDGEARDWSGTPLAVTGAVPAGILEAFEGLGFAPFSLPPALKPLYHAAAVLTSGHAATLWLGAERLLADAGVVLPGRGLWLLAEATVRNVQSKGAAGRTGPFVRGDAATIQRDRDALPEPWATIFEALGDAPI